MEKITTPILFLVFNRPEKTQRVFEVIRQAQPSKLYIAADAPRENTPTDFDKCINVRHIVQQIDWDCDVQYLFHEKNLGCSLAGKTAWDWVFSQEEEMIFIEDDGLISLSFFYYCQELLRKYKDDENVAYIGGVNYGQYYPENVSYYPTRCCAATYAMATWKRVYVKYEYKMESYKLDPNHRKLRTFYGRKYYPVIREKYDTYVNYGGNTYDVQMLYLVAKYNMISLYPNVNLVSNIGLDKGGANNDCDPTSKIALRYGNRPRTDIWDIQHPSRLLINGYIEKAIKKERIFMGQPLLKVYYYLLLNKIKRILPGIVIKYMKMVKSSLRKC